MEFIKKEILIGFLIAILSTCCSLYIYSEYILEKELKEVFKQIQQIGILGAVISLSAIPNLFIFFIFLKKNQDYRAKGVLIATFFIAFITLITKFF